MDVPFLRQPLRAVFFFWFACSACWHVVNQHCLSHAARADCAAVRPESAPPRLYIRHAYTCTCTDRDTYTQQLHIRRHKYRHIHVGISTRASKYTQKVCLSGCTYTYAHTDMHVYKHVYRHVYRHINMHTPHTYAHARIHRY